MKLLFDFMAKRALRCARSAPLQSPHEDEDLRRLYRRCAYDFGVRLDAEQLRLFAFHLRSPDFISKSLTHANRVGRLDSAEQPRNPPQARISSARRQGDVRVQ